MSFRRLRFDGRKKGETSKKGGKRLLNLFQFAKICILVQGIPYIYLCYDCGLDNYE